MRSLQEEVLESWIASFPEWSASKETGDFRTRIVTISAGFSEITFTREDETYMSIAGLFGFHELDVSVLMTTLGICTKWYGVTDYLAWAKIEKYRFAKLLTTRGRRTMIQASEGSGEVFKEFILSDLAYEAAQLGESPIQVTALPTSPPIVSDFALAGSQRKSIRLGSLIIEMPTSESGAVLFRLEKDYPGSREWHSIPEWARRLWKKVLDDSVDAQLAFLKENLCRIELMLSPKYFGGVSNLLDRSYAIEQRVQRAWESL